tara:strand:- start:262 stop:456 length:195 start_codon:yes stop_codon:yes gene_type:complete
MKALTDYMHYLEECAEKRLKLDEELKDVKDQESLDAFLLKVEGMKPMYEKLKVLEDRIHTRRKK